MTVLKKKIINFRFFPILFLCICMGSLIASLTFSKPFFDYYVIGIGLVLGIIVLFATKGRGLALLFICAFLLSYLLASVQIDDGIKQVESAEGDIVTVRVEHVEDNVIYVSVKEGMEISGLSQFDTTGVYDYPLDVGCELILGDVKVQKISPLEADGVLNTYYYNSQTKYVMTAKELLGFQKGSPNIVEIIRNSLTNAIDNMPYELRGVTMALLTGDKYAISSKTYDAYRVSGVAHVLAVSGLHVGFLVIFLEWLLKRFRLRRLLRIFIILPVAFFLCALCDFTPSVVRSAIMVGVHLLIPVLSKRRYDMLSSISLSGVIIVLASPMSIYSYGFLLSFASVIGIILFANRFDKMLKFLPRFISKTVSVSLATTVTVFPLSVYLFGEFSLLSIVTNVLVLPVMTVGYGILVGLACIAVVFPPFSFVIVGGSWLVYYLNFITGVIASVDIASISLSAPLWFIALYYMFVLLLSDFVNLSKTVKRLILISFIILGCAYFSFFCNFSPKIY